MKHVRVRHSIRHTYKIVPLFEQRPEAKVPNNRSCEREKFVRVTKPLFPLKALIDMHAHPKATLTQVHD